MLVEVRLAVPAQEADAWSNVLAAQGDERWSVYEDVDARAACVLGYFADEPAARAGMAALRAVLPRALGRCPEPHLRTVADEDWRESYKAHFRAWRHGRLHWVPEWERATHRLARGHVAVYLDPGMAFGTGNHETTRLCVHKLVTYAEPLPARARARTSVIDAGCGSGILAISAAKLGFGDVFAFDNDPEAVAIARKNARRNDVGGGVRLAVGDLHSGLKRRRADLVLANIQANVLVAHAPILVGAVAPGGRLVLSGILRIESESVAAHFRSVVPGGAIRVRHLGEWSSVTWSAPTV